MSSTAPVTDETFDTEVLGSDLPVVVDFWAPWCGPCRQVAPILEELAGVYDGRLRIVKVNTDENPETASRYGVVSIPTLNVYAGGELVRSLVGARPKPALVKEFDTVLEAVHTAG